MTLRGRLASIAAAAVAIAIVSASVIVWFVVRDDLRGQVDRSLRELAGGASVAPAPPRALPRRVVEPIFPRRRDQIAPRARRGVRLAPAPAGQRRGRRPFLALPRQPPGSPGAYSQVVTGSGRALRPSSESPGLPVTDAAHQVATGRLGPFFSDAEVSGSHLRVLTQRIGPDAAIQVARSLDDVDATMEKLTLVLAVVTVAGVAVAALLGRWVARATLAPVARLTQTAEEVAETRNLGRRIEVPGRGDELSRLAASFNRMLAEIDQAVGAQRRLVADASHELRTPLTSLRTNLEVLARGNGLDEASRSRLLQDVVAQFNELGALVGDLLELARDEDRTARYQAVELDDLVAARVERARQRARHLTFETEIEQCVVWGDPERLARAISNLLDNAAKWSPPGSTISITLAADGVLAVRDRGPGIDPRDLAHVFDRFYRGGHARGMPGSGLGLAIVREVAREHGGAVEATPGPGGGAVLRVRLPVAEDSLNSSPALT
jgi:two-component system, OmpR family, sensor histidine kinase MprB